jgi:glycine cleavage system T protein
LSLLNAPSLNVVNRAAWRYIFVQMSKQSPLLSLHQSNGATLAEYDGKSLPRHFGDPAEEYLSIRRTVGLLDFSNRALLEFTGVDRLSYLQGLISNDLRQPSSGEGMYAAFLSQQGKVFGDCRVLTTDDSFIVDLWEPLKPKILDHLHRYLVADEVEITDLSDRCAILSIQGPNAETLVEKFVPKNQQPQKTLAHSLAEIAGVETRICRYSHTGEDGFDLIIPIADIESVARQLTEAASEYSARWVGAEAYETLRIEAGIPRYGVDITDDNLILETGLTHAVSFNKGCYLGQEVVERIRSRGHVNKNLIGLVIDGKKPPSAGSKILSAEKEIGTITSSVYSPALESPIALGYVHRDHRSPGTQLLVRHDNEVLSATVAELPFTATPRNTTS